jgi:arylsulfatase A-like enzyme
MINFRLHAGIQIAALFFAGLASHAETAPLPNIVIVSIDTLRADHCSVYGYPRNTTPTLTKLASEGALFNQAYAPMGQTGPSHATLFTGLYPTGHGLVKNGRVLPETHSTLAEQLKAKGYSTAAFVSAFPLDRRFGLDRGFDVYNDIFPLGQQTVEIQQWEGQALTNAFDRRGDYTLVKAAEWLGRRPDDAPPFFLFVHLFDPHTPYKPPRVVLQEVVGQERPKDQLKMSKLLYDGEVRFADLIVEKLLYRLETLGFGENTIIVITSDHGEGLMQRGYLLHGITVHEEEVRVPLLIHWPGHIPAGRKVEEPVTIADVMPTLLGLIESGTDSPDVEGRDLAAALREGKPAPADRPILFMRPKFPKTTIASGWSGTLSDGQTPPRIPVHGAHYGARLDVWKYIVSPKEGTTALYNLQADPNELTNVADRHASIAKLMHRHIDQWLANAPAESMAEELLDEETLKALEALGYTN